MKSAFILSPSYSGSTLLSMLLAHHPGLVTLGEFLNNRERKHQEGEGDFCSCGARLPDCPLMSGLAGRLHERGVEFSVDFPDTAFLGDQLLVNRVLRSYVRSRPFEALRRAVIAAVPAVRKELHRVVDRNLAVISTLLDMEEADVYLDSAKNANRVLFFERYAPSMEVKVIWMVRDGRGVVNSIRRHSGRDTEAATRRWLITQRSVIQAIGHLPAENVLRMHYEDLCADPGHWLPETCRFLGLEPDQLPESYGCEDLHLTGNNMRLNGLGEIRLDEKWKTAMTAEALRTFERIGGGLNRSLGYTAEGPER